MIKVKRRLLFFIKAIKENPGILAKGRKVLGKDGEFQLREEMRVYNAAIEAKKEDIGPENTYFWNENS